jgi:hypothetical protein
MLAAGAAALHPALGGWGGGGPALTTSLTSLSGSVLEAGGGDAKSPNPSSSSSSSLAAASATAAAIAAAAAAGDTMGYPGICMRSLGWIFEKRSSDINWRSLRGIIWISLDISGYLRISLLDI